MFPLYVNLEDKICIVAGGGKVALRKISVLKLFTDHITVIAPDILPEIYPMAEKALNRKMIESDIDNAFLCIASTDDREFNTKLAVICKKRGVFVNSATDVYESTFHFPAIIKKGSVTIGINSEGAPALSKQLKKIIENGLPGNIDIISQQMLLYREKVKELLTEEELKAKMNHMAVMELEQSDTRNTGKPSGNGAGKHCGE